MKSLKAGPCQISQNDEDEFHPGKKVGIGVYLTPSIKEAENNAGQININGKNYKVVLMARVKPSSIRKSKGRNDSWVLNGDCDDTRIYRILFKEC